MDERAFYTEKEETRKIKLVCPSCHGEFEFPVRWKVSRKKRELPRGAGEEDRRKFAKATNVLSLPGNPLCSSTIISATPTPTPRISATADSLSIAGVRRSGS